MHIADDLRADAAPFVGASVRCMATCGRGAMIQIDAIPITDREAWTQAQDGLRPLATQGWDYCRILAQGFGLPMELAVVVGPEGRAACPLFRRPIPGTDRFDIATPVGYGGFAGVGALAGLRSAWVDFWRGRGAVSSYVQLHPFVGRELLAGPLAEFEPDAAPGAFTVSLPLSGRSADDMLAGMRRDHRSRIRQWLARENRFEFDQLRLASAFVEIFPPFRKERGMGALYALPEAQLKALTELPETWMAGARGVDGRIEAVSLFLFSERGADYHFNAARADGRRHARALVWAAILEALRRETPVLHLAGGVSADDSLDEFKSGFGGVREPAISLRTVIDPAEYAAQCAKAGIDPSSTGYFPAYRRRASV